MKTVKKSNSYIILILLVIGILAYATSHANPKERDSESFGRFDFSLKKGPCAKLNLDNAQKSQIKEAFFKFRESKIDLKADIKRARLSYEKLTSDPKSDLNAAQAVSQTLTENKSKLVAAKESLKNQILFKILKPEQRESGLMCVHQFERRGHHRPFWKKSHFDGNRDDGDHGDR